MSHEIDAAWMTRALQGDLRTAAEIVGYTAAAIGTGQVGENVRFELLWDLCDPDLPTSVVGKFPSPSDVSRATAVQLNTYVKEIGFYRHLQQLVHIRTPRIHALEWDPETHDFVVLMEDIRPARQGDQLAGCDLEQAKVVVDQAVGLHAPTWGARVHGATTRGWARRAPRSRSPSGHSCSAS